MGNILLLTATITPPAGVPDLIRTNPAERFEDYLKAFRFYLKEELSQIDRVIFVDNSSTLRLPLKKLVVNGKTVEVISYDGLDYPPSYGRGYGEFKMIDFVMANSKIIQSASGTDRIWKVTGRYVVKNLERIIKRAPKDYNLYCNLRRWRKPWADMYLMSWTKKGYDAVLNGIYPKLREENTIRISPEIRMWDIIKPLVKKENIVPRFNVQPFVDGIRGFDNRNYSEGSDLVKYYLRMFSRRVMPWVWI